jgi:hypothetical protein
MAGYAQGLSGQATHSAAFWVPATFVSTTLAAALAAARLLVVERRARPL